MVRLRTTVAVAAAVAVAAPAAAALTASEARADERGYRLLNADAKKPAPLVVALHCYSCDTDYVPQKLGLETLAKQGGFVVAVPAGRTDRGGNPFWNATDACCDFDGKKPDDVGYVLRVIDELVKRGIADGKRIYLVGYSNGGFLAYRIACDHADKIAAIVSIGGAAPTRCTPSAPVAVLDVHADADTVVPASGGPIGGELPRRARIPSVDETLAVWARADGCEVAATDGQRRCKHAGVARWTMHGGHVQIDADLGPRIWRWLATQHK